MTRGRPFVPGNKFGRGRPKGSPNKISSQQAVECRLSIGLRGLRGQPDPLLVGRVRSCRHPCGVSHDSMPVSGSPNMPSALQFGRERFAK